MNKIFLTALILMASTCGAYAGGSHAGGHAAKMAVGKPGKMAQVKRSIEIIMTETDDGDMLFKPKSVKVKKGETIRFVVINAGVLEHEFVLDTHKEIMKHKAVMKKFPEMEHDDPNSVRLDEGKKGEIVWKFSNNGTFEFACLIPGHYEAGMKGTIKVATH